MGAVYLFHDLYGYLMEMSPDIAAMIQSFDDGVDTEETIRYYAGKFGVADPRQFVDRSGTSLAAPQRAADPAVRRRQRHRCRCAPARRSFVRALEPTGRGR